MNETGRQKRLRVLLIEDDTVDQKAFERFIRQEQYPYDYVIAGSVGEAKRVLMSEKFDVVITDYQLSDGTGMDVLGFRIEAPVILTTGTGSEELAVQAMKAGAYDYLIKDPDRYYLKVLGLTIEKTMTRKESEDRIKMLSYAIMGIHDSVLIVDGHGQIIFVNQAFCTTYGYMPAAILGQPASVFWEDRAAGGIPEKTEGEFIHKRKDGETFPVLFSSSVLRDENKNVIASVYIILDITERRQAEQALLRQTEQLARSKTELEQLELFSFIASHDLQEPLHKINMMTSLLKKQAGPDMNEQTRDYLERIERSVKRMGERIDRTRDFSRVVREGKPFRTVDLGALLRQAAKDLEARLGEIGGITAIDGTFPSVEADEVQLKQMFRHLLENAVKFRRKDVPLKVTIRNVPAEPGYVAVAVEDNGIGFNDAYHERIFRPFESLHPFPDDEGIGMGLAICQKIILRHGGRIDARSSSDTGSVFTATLPLKQIKEGDQ
ncbi:MAG: ATP-binding protein [Candidatus Omnitrophota bacterium]